MFRPTVGGQTTSTYFSEEAGPSSRSDVPMHHHTQSSHGYHTVPPQGDHYQWQQATTPSAQRVTHQRIAPKVPHSYGLQLPTPSTASDSSLRHEGEHSYDILR